MSVQEDLSQGGYVIIPVLHTEEVKCLQILQTLVIPEKDCQPIFNKTGGKVPCHSDP